MMSSMSAEELMSALDALEERVPKNMKKKVQELKDVVAEFEDEEEPEEEMADEEESDMSDEEYDASEDDSSYEDEQLAKMFG